MARRGLTQEAVARRSGTSQPTLSACERGTKSPALAVAERILHSLGFDLGLQPRERLVERLAARGLTAEQVRQMLRRRQLDAGRRR